jgi:hypothetical protein
MVVKEENIGCHLNFGTPPLDLHMEFLQRNRPEIRKIDIDSAKSRLAQQK